MTREDPSSQRASEPSEHGVALSLVSRVAVIQRLAERLAAAADLSALARSVTSELRSGLEASAVSLGMISADGSSLVTLIAEGFSPAATQLMSAPIELSGGPASAALLKGVPVLWSTLAERDRDFPEYAGYASSMESWAILPLLARGNSIGVLSIGWVAPHHFSDLESAFLGVIAHQCALAVDRARIDQVRRAERETLELLNEGTRLMVSALEPARVIEALVGLAVPRLAPWCAVYVAEGRTLRRVAIEISGEEEMASELRGHAALSVDDPVPLAAAFRSGSPQVVVPVDETVVRTLYAEPHASRILGRTGPWAGLCVPVKAAGEVIGVMSLVSDEWGTSPPDEVRFAAEGLAGRAGVALVNARRFEDERRTAQMLMDAFLPSALPTVPGYDVFARYLPAGSKVAGDWFDLVALRSGEYLVGIGDAGGHGIQAAALMGQLRNAARGLAVTGAGPVAILEGLHRLTTAEGEESFATAAYGLVDPVSHTVRWASAGHLPPLAFSEKSARFLDHHRNPPLGWAAPSTPEHVARWTPGSGIVLVTDGVVERRARGLEEGMDQLRDVVAANASLGARDLTDRIAELMCGRAEDDCCVVVLKRR